MDRLSELGGSGLAVVANGVERTYGGEGGVRSVDLAVPAGSILGVVGPSGCGKTTLLRLIAGITRPTAGELRVLGREPQLFTAPDRSRLGYMPQLPVLLPNLTVWSNLHFLASLYGVGLRRRRRMREVLSLVDLVEHRRKLVANCSGGMQRRLALAATLVHEPDLLLLDEPTAGIDPILRERFWERFRDLRDAGRTLVISTQYVGEAAECDLVAVMAEGRLLVVGAPEELRRHAFGGELVEVRPAGGWLSGADLARLAAEPWALAAEQRSEAVLIVVDEAAEGVSRATEHFEREGIAVTSVEPIVPSYDDVFVALVEGDRAAATEVEPAGRQDAA